MKSFTDFRREVLASPGVKAAYEAMEDEFALARALIEARSQAGLTQEALAEKMQTTQATVARWESGKHLPSCQTLQRIARATNTALRISFCLRRPRKRRGHARYPQNPPSMVGGQSRNSTELGVQLCPNLSPFYGTLWPTASVCANHLFSGRAAVPYTPLYSPQVHEAVIDEIDARDVQQYRVKKAKAKWH